MSSSRLEEGGVSEALTRFLDNPILRYVAEAVALLSGIGKIIDLGVDPGFPSWAKVMLWVIFVLALLIVAILGYRAYPTWLLKSLIAGTGPKKPADKEIAGEVAYKFNSQLYGLAHQELITHCMVRPDGSAAFRREIEMVAYAPVDTTELYMILPEAQKTGEGLLEVIRVEPLTELYRIQKKETMPSSGQMYLTLSFLPALEPGDCMRYAVEEESDPGLYDVGGQALRQMEYDYFAWDIIKPTKKLVMKVIFPEGFMPAKVEPDVWHALGQGQSTHSREFNRVKELLRRGREGIMHTLEFAIPYPILGMTYVIRWYPRESGSMRL
jgi:hypothetical protein